MHWNSEITLEKIRKGDWDVVILQEHSQRTSYDEKDICEISYPFAKLLSHEIHQNNPNAKIQWYQTWGRPYGDEDRCKDIPKVCTYEGMIRKMDVYVIRMLLSLKRIFDRYKKIYKISFF